MYHPNYHARVRPARSNFPSGWQVRFVGTTGLHLMARTRNDLRETRRLSLRRLARIALLARPDSRRELLLNEQAKVSTPAAVRRAHQITRNMMRR